jgi:hypothetical protein
MINTCFFVLAKIELAKIVLAKIELAKIEYSTVHKPTCLCMDCMLTHATAIRQRL